jgi:hypothetical protein
MENPDGDFLHWFEYCKFGVIEKAKGSDDFYK